MPGQLPELRTNRDDRVGLRAGSLAEIPPVESEPDAPADDIAGVLADAEAIVNAAEPEVIAQTDSKRPRWWRRRRRGGPDDGEEFRLSNR